MAGRTDGPDGEASLDEPRPAAGQEPTASGQPPRADARPEAVEKADGEADTEITAGDLADDLADFA